METTEFQVDSCVLVIAAYKIKLELHFGKELPTEREFGNFVDHYTVAVKHNVSVMMFLQHLKTRSEVILLTT